MRIPGVCVYGGSSNHVDQKYLDAAYQIGAGIAKRGWTLVNGAGDTGMMGAATRGALSENGKTTGIAPEFFAQPGVLFEEGKDTVFTKTMRERKAFMESLSMAFIATPGGIGTLEELYEIMVLKQLGQESAPLIVLNLDGYYDSLIKAMHDMEEAGFIHETVFDLFDIADSVDAVFDILDKALVQSL